MQLKEYILNNLEYFDLSSNIKDTNESIEKHRFSHLPIIENNKLVGAIAESDLSTIEEVHKPLSDYTYLFSYFFAKEDDNLMELITLFSIHDTNILPVIDKEKNFLGYYDLSDILTVYAETPYIREEGIVLLIEKDNTSYTMSEVSQIIESNRGKLLGAIVAGSSEKRTQILVKIKAENSNEIIQSFRRYAYNVLSKHKEDRYLEDLKKRSEYLQKYLNM